MLVLFQNEYGFAPTKGQYLKHQQLTLFTVAKLPLVINSVGKTKHSIPQLFWLACKNTEVLLDNVVLISLVYTVPNHPYGETADML